MTPIRVFVNAAPVDVPSGADVRYAVEAFDPALGVRLAAGTASVTDARGIPLASDARLVPGSILRVVLSARRPGVGTGESPA